MGVQPMMSPFYSFLPQADVHPTNFLDFQPTSVLFIQLLDCPPDSKAFHSTVGPFTRPLHFPGFGPDDRCNQVVLHAEGPLSMSIRESRR